ncbi:MAG: hypothetical protein AAB874_06005 [Patescibacteria group bacterium]
MSIETLHEGIDGVLRPIQITPFLDKHDYAELFRINPFYLYAALLEMEGDDKCVFFGVAPRHKELRLALEAKKPARIITIGQLGVRLRNRTLYQIHFEQAPGNTFDDAMTNIFFVLSQIDRSILDQSSVSIHWRDKYICRYLPEKGKFER